MGKDFLPRGDGQLLQWSRNFSQQLNDPDAHYPVPPESAAAYALLDDEYSAAYRAANAPSTRTSGSVIFKNDVRTRLKREARILARFLQSRIELTDPQRAALRLSIATGGSPIPRPADAPVMEIVSASGWQVVAQLRQAGSGRRGKGPHILAAHIWYATGEQPPSTWKEWKHLMMTSRTRVTVKVPPGLAAGTRVWLCAKWVNPRGEFGPGNAAVGVIIGGGVPQLASPAQSVRQAA